MKKMFTLFLCLVLVGSLGLPAFAASRVYPIEDLGIELEIPSRYIVMTRDYVSDEIALKLTGQTQEGLKDMYESKAIFLNALELEYPLKEIVITGMQTRTPDFSTRSDEELLAYGETVRHLYEAMKAEFVSMSVYETDWNKFLKFEIIMPTGSGPDELTQYTTGFNGMTINFTKHAYNVEVTERDRLDLEETVKSVRTLSAEKGGSAEQGLFYYDDLTGISFTLPADWKVDVDVGNIARSTTFKPVADPSVTFAFLREEFWNNLSEEEKQGKTRDSYGVEEFINTRYKSRIGIQDNAEIIQLNSGEYVKWERERNVETASGTKAVPLNFILHVEDGFYYGFIIPYESDVPYYDEVMQTIDGLVF